MNSNISITQALKLGVEAHKAGNFQKADLFYTAILKVKPNHPDANHNMGVLAVSVGKIREALPFFRTALKINPGISQFWISYIDALIELGKLNEARETIYEAKLKGVNSGLFTEHYKEIIERLNRSLEHFYNNLIKDIVSVITKGWLYAISFDYQFLSDNEPLKDKRYPVKKTQKPSQNEILKSSLPFLPNDIVTELNSITNLKARFERLEQISSSKNSQVFSDSFFKFENLDLKKVLELAFAPGKLNILVIGAGPCGLYLANALKQNLKNNVNILVLDNDCDTKHIKRPFRRRWLTHLPTNLLGQYFDKNMLKLAASFGKNGYIGLPLNLIEFILYLSSKISGVQFYFDTDFDCDFLNSDLIDLIFDATGGRMRYEKTKKNNDSEYTIELLKNTKNFENAGSNKITENHILDDKKISLKLGKDGYFYYPYINKQRLLIRMIKLSSVPFSANEILKKYLETNNRFNRFYIWAGDLVDELNELLIFVNLHQKEYNYLQKMIKYKQHLSNGSLHNLEENKSLGKEVLDFFKFLVSEVGENQINIDPPFISQSPLNLYPLKQKINGVKIFPIGDSLYRGNPKIGNGLGYHIQHISKLVETVL